MEDNYYLFLSEKSYLKFDPVSQITNVFFDDSKKQIFIVKLAVVSVKSIVEENESFSFLIESSPLIAIKFNAGNNILAIQRTENSIELQSFNNNQLVPNSTINYQTKKSIVYGFIWSQPDELVILTCDHVEIFQVNTTKKTMKSLKSIAISSDWFSWNRSSFAILSSSNGMVITPVLLQKPGTITKLASIHIEDEPVNERDVNTGTIYKIPSILILRTARNKNLEIWVYLMDGPTFKKTHVLKLGFSGRVAISVIDSMIIVHNQNLKISSIFDIAMKGELDTQNNNIINHAPLVPGKSIRPFTVKLPSMTLKESSREIELYSPNWVIFQPDVIIDVKLGFLFSLSAAINKVSICDKIELVEFLMHRQNEKEQLLFVLMQLVSPDDCNESVHLPILETIFDKLNKVYKQKLDYDLVKMQALPSPSSFKSFSSPVPLSPQFPSQIVVEQSDILQILNTIVDKNILEKVLMAYVFSIVKYSISCECELSKLLVMTLVGSQKVKSADGCKHEYSNISF